MGRAFGVNWFPILQECWVPPLTFLSNRPGASTGEEYCVDQGRWCTWKHFPNGAVPCKRYIYSHRGPHFHQETFVQHSIYSLPSAFPPLDMDGMVDECFPQNSLPRTEQNLVNYMEWNETKSWIGWSLGSWVPCLSPLYPSWQGIPVCHHSTNGSCFLSGQLKSPESKTAIILEQRETFSFLFWLPLLQPCLIYIFQLKKISLQIKWQQKKSLIRLLFLWHLFPFCLLHEVYISFFFLLQEYPL